MSHRIVVFSPARRDVVEQGEYLARHSLEAADRFVDAVDAALVKLAAAPELGELQIVGPTHRLQVRRWPVPGFRNRLIFYRVTSESIEVLRVLHSSQNWQTILDDFVG